MELPSQIPFPLAPDSELLDPSRNDLFFKFEFRHDGIILGERIIGECHVPILDLINDVCGDDVAAFIVAVAEEEGGGKRI
ncbi:MAG: hypothetical protein Q8765_02585 [Sweet potato little leaf phytoplasma]|nr:hypothetical protein [Sweet potato little leaf phytoplasma]